MRSPTRSQGRGEQNAVPPVPLEPGEKGGEVVFATRNRLPGFISLNRYTTGITCPYSIPLNRYKEINMSLRAVVIHPNDNVANLIGAGLRGQQVECTIEGEPETVVVELAEDVPANHKFALTEIAAGEPVIKYGFPIGRATCPIGKGQCVHVHNIESNRGRGDLQGAGRAAQAGH